MTKRIILTCIIAFIGIFFCAYATQAGFGISPPYVKTAKPIFAGSHFEQKITLLRSSADEVLSAEIRVNAPEIEDWISIDKGDIFDLPKDQLQIPMIVMVDVPKDVDIGNYRGHINVRIVPKQGSQSSGVAIALGARIDIDLTITDQTFVDFIIRKVEIPNLEVLKKPWSWKIFSWFFYRIKVVMMVENTGNVESAPTRVHLEVYDIGEKELLEEHDDKRIKKVPPFTTSDISASFPTDLPTGQYWAKIKIYKENEIIQNNKISFDVVPHGNLGIKLGIWPWIMMGGIFIIIAIFILFLIKIKVWIYLFRIFLIITWPFRFLGKKFKLIFNSLKLKFWKWLHKKSARYQKEKNDEEK